MLLKCLKQALTFIQWSSKALLLNDHEYQILTPPLGFDSLQVQLQFFFLQVFCDGAGFFWLMCCGELAWWGRGRQKERTYQCPGKQEHYLLLSQKWA
jgi:hypothetical protein